MRSDIFYHRHAALDNGGLWNIEEARHGGPAVRTVFERPRRQQGARRKAFRWQECVRRSARNNRKRLIFARRGLPPLPGCSA